MSVVADTIIASRPSRFSTAVARAPRESTLIVADMVASSGSNALLLMVAARASSADAFGAVALAFTIYVAVSGVLRAAFGTAQLVDGRYHRLAPHRWAAALATASGISMLVLLVAGVIGARGGDFADELAVLAATLPGLALFDLRRMTFLAEGRAASALMLDLAWAAPLVLAALVGAGAGIVWLTWCLVGAVLGLASSVPAMRSTPARASLRAGRARAGFLSAGAVDGALVALVMLGGTAAVSASNGVAAAGALRGAMTVMGPLTVLWSAAVAFALPRWNDLPGTPVRRAAHLSLWLSGAAVGVAVLAALLGPLVGTSLFGSSWDAIAHVVPWWALAMAFSALEVGPASGLRAMGDAQSVARARLLAAPLYFGLGIGGGLLGPEWFCIGVGIAALAVTGALWRTFLARVGEPDATTDADEPWLLEQTSRR